MSVRIKRVYEPPAAEDGARILVDRLWPRGIAKDKAKIEVWLKDVAPSDALRRRVHADPAAWDMFVLDYGRELMEEPARSAAEALLGRIAREPVTLLYAARDEARNNAVALKNWLEARLPGAGRKRPRAAAPSRPTAKKRKRPSR
jgi:uncharacterized protein YeaO (DUF488 family)